MVTSLLAARAAVEHRDLHQSTAMHVAARGGHVEVSAVLLEHRADVMAADERGMTPFHHASLSGRLRMLEHLLHTVRHSSQGGSKGSHVDHVLHMADATGKSPLQILLFDHGLSKTQEVKIAVVTMGRDDNTEAMSALPLHGLVVEGLTITLTLALTINNRNSPNLNPNPEPSPTLRLTC